MSKMLDILLDKMDEHVSGSTSSRLYVSRDEWDDTHEGFDWASCYSSPTEMCGDLFPVSDLIKNLSWPNNFYSFRYRNGYPKIKDMDDKQLLNMFNDWLSHLRYECSPFGSGSDESWDWEPLDINGKLYIFTYNYIGS